MSGPHSTSKSSAKNHLTSLELFAGAGGLALGVHAAGFQHLGLIEKDAFAVETLRDNSRRVLDLDPKLILSADAQSIDYATYAGKVDLLSGGPPCQPFSTAGSNRGPEDPRNMFPVFFDVVAAIMPKAILIENVKGLCRPMFRDYFAYILKRLQYPLHKIKEGESWQDHYKRLSQVTGKGFGEHEQYVVKFQVVDAADFGVPQRRERVVIHAFRRDLNIEPCHLSATHCKQSLLVQQWITLDYWKNHGVSSYDFLGKNDKRLVANLRKELFRENGLLPWCTVRDALSDLPDPVHRGSEATFPNHIQHPGARIYSNHIGSFYDYPAKALKAGTHGTPGGENMLRFSTDKTVRYFTTREAARLQTFPDDWHFHGTWGACIRQLGNAVPVLLAKIFAEAIHQRLVDSLNLQEKNDTPAGVTLEERHDKSNGRHHTPSKDSASLRRNRVKALAVRS